MRIRIYWCAVALCLAAAPVSAQTVTATHINTGTDSVPRFCAVPSVTSAGTGNWSSAGTWSTGSAPGSDARVRITAGTDVTYDVLSNIDVYCIEVDAGATLRFAVDRDTRLRVVHLTVLPNGTLIVGDTAQPIQAGVTTEIVIPDHGLEVNGQDPHQFGNGLLVYGTLDMHGRAMSQTFIRLGQEPRAGDSVLQLQEPPVGWLPGDTLVIPDTRQIPFRKDYTIVSQAELPVVASVLGSQVTLAAPLQYDHLGPRDMNGNVGPVEAQMRPHVGNLTRNVIVRSEAISESPKGVYCEAPDHIDQPETCITRGHTIVFRRSDVDVRYVNFENLGRTAVSEPDLTTVDGNGTVTAIGRNQIARYPVHTHHLIGPVNPSDQGYQFQLIGNVVRGFLKWGIAIHASHYGLIQWNIVYDGKASAIAAEDGSESFNVFEKNFVVHQGAGKPIEALLASGRAGVTDGPLFNGRSNFGFMRDCFWFTTPNNYVRDNVATNCTFGYNYNGYYTNRVRRSPNFRGADMMTDSFAHEGRPALESARNEAYGAIGQGLWMGWSRGCCNVSTYEAENVLSDYRIWHASNSGVETYHESRNTFEGFIIRNDPDVSAMSEGGSLRYTRGFRLGNASYQNGQTIIRNADVQGFNIGIEIPLNPSDGTPVRDIFRIEDTRLRNYVNIERRLSVTAADGDSVLRNVQFDTLSLPAVSGQPASPQNVWLHYLVDDEPNLSAPSRLFLYDFQGTPGDDYELFFVEQGPNFPMPADSLFTHRGYAGCPEDGLTNLECYSQHGVATGGAIAPCIERDNDPSCSAALARGAAMGISGLVFPVAPGSNSWPRAATTQR